MRKIYLSAGVLLCLSFNTLASGVDSLKIWRDSVNSSYTYQKGKINLKNGIAVITVPVGYKYLDGTQSNDVLTRLWGNPPSDESLGMLFPEKSGPADTKSWAIDVTYSEDGFIKDDDAKDINYTDLLKEMQADTDEENKARVEAGYEPVKLIGWAVSPFYDAESHKLHWAKELQFGKELSEFNTLNYNIRILGRRGYLMLNAIGDMSMLPALQKDIPSVLASVEFNDGNKYVDFDPSIDQVATYGIGGLIAGKVLAKVGFFAVLAKFFNVILIAALKFWKLVIIAFIALISGIKKFMGRKKGTDSKSQEENIAMEEEQSESLLPVAEHVEEEEVEPCTVMKL